MIASVPPPTLPAGAAPAAARPGPLPRVLYAIALDGTQKFGSLEEQIYFLAEAFRAGGSLLLPLYLEPGGPGRAGTRAFDAAGLPTASLDLRRFRLATLARLHALIGRQRIEVVHWNFYPPLANGYLWALSALRPRVKHYFTDHNSRLFPLPAPPTGLGRAVKGALLKRYRKVFCVSRFVQDCLTAQGSWSHLECCLHFINTDRFQPDGEARLRVRRQTGAGERFVAVTVAHLIPEKGVDVLLRALAEAPDVLLWVVGTGAEAAALRALAAELGVADRVNFLGQQVHVQPYLQAADCFVCPSLWAEAAGLVNLEALATGLPVLASRIGGIPEYVADGTTGLLFPPGDHHALGELLRRVHQQPALRRRLGQAARAAAVERFSVPSKISDYLDLYRQYH